MKEHLILVANPTDSYLKSAHAQAIARGNMNAATCTACHGSHDLFPSDNPDSKVYRKNIKTTCAACHPKAAAEYEKSIHGARFRRG